MASQLALLCSEHAIELRAEHIPGKENIEADDASRGRTAARTGDFTFMHFHAFNDPLRPFTVDAAADRAGWNAQQGCASFFSSGQRSFLDHWAEAAGQRIWCHPPRDMVGAFMDAVLLAWGKDAATSCVMVVPDWPTRPWYRRARLRKRPVWREIASFPPGRPVCYVGLVGHRREKRPGPPQLAPANPDFGVLVLAFP